jgi:pseudo-rSAM protein
MMKPTYYYTLYPDTFLWINETEGVMYNAKEHTYLSFDIHGLIKKYCLMLNELRNLYTIDVSPEDWEDTDLRSWMLDTVENKMGCLIEYSDTESRPISFPPLLNLQSDVDRIEKEKGREVGEYVAYNWNELSLFLGGQSEHPNYCRQFLYPIADEHFLDIQTLETFLATANNTYLLQVNVIGDILQYPYKKQLMCLLGGLTAKVCLYMLGDNAKGIGDLLNSSEFDKDKYELVIIYNLTA